MWCGICSGCFQPHGHRWTDTGGLRSCGSVAQYLVRWGVNMSYVASVASKPFHGCEWGEWGEDLWSCLGTHLFERRQAHRPAGHSAPRPDSAHRPSQATGEGGADHMAGHVGGCCTAECHRTTAAGQETKGRRFGGQGGFGVLVAFLWSS